MSNFLNLATNLLNVDDLPENFREPIKFLVNENWQLKLNLTALSQQLISSQSDVAKLKDQQTSNYLITTQNEDLKRVVEELTKENEALRDKIEALRDIIEALEVQNIHLLEKIDGYDKRLLEIEAKDNPISIREAMRILESHICFEAVGRSKTKFKKFYNFKKIMNGTDLSIQSTLSNILAIRGLSNPHLDTISFLKDLGAISAHHKRTVLSKDDWILLVSEGDDVEEIQISLHLLDVL